MELKEVTKNFLREETCSTCAFFYKKDNSCYLGLDMSFGTCEIWSSSISVDIDVALCPGQWQYVCSINKEDGNLKEKKYV